jgi:predicted amidohydrolase YtcJ
MDPAVEGNSIWWNGGIIRAVGDAPELSRLVPTGTPTFEFPQALVTPGFVDSHTHFVMWAIGRGLVQLTGTKSREEALGRVAGAAPVDGWILGQGWDANSWESPPTRWALDKVGKGPICLDSLDVHAVWVNSAALEAAGITRETPDPFGGRIVRDSSGEPTGLLLERAVELVGRILPPPSSDRVLRAVADAQGEALRLGVTGIHNVEGPEAFQAFAVLEAQDALHVRVLFHHPVADLEHLVQTGVRSGLGSSWLTHGGIKMFLDGSLGSRTAWMLKPYEGTRDRGMPITELATATQATRMAAEHGLACVVHAIGDAAVRRALDLLENLPAAGVSHRIEHFQCVHPHDITRAARAGIVLSMQPAHLLTDIPLAERHWGRRSEGAYAFRTLLGKGSLIAFGSDTPVASIDPRQGVFAAMERRQLETGSPRWVPRERLDFLSAIHAYTRAAALAGGAGDRRGKLAPGLDADLVVWQDGEGAERGDGSAFLAAKVGLTVVGGRIMYSDS